MVFSKTFPKSSDKSVYPKWEEIYLTKDEESRAEKECQNDNVLKMMQCIDDAKNIVHDKKLLESQQILVEIAKSLFDKRASHEVFFKEKKAKEKFDILKKENK